MEESILVSIKKLLGISKECTDFDTDIIIHINTVFRILNQMGVGPEEGFRIEDSDTTWSEYIQDNKKLDDIITYIYLKVKLIFDPPLNGTVINANKQMIDELEWRLNFQSES